MTRGAGLGLFPAKSLTVPLMEGDYSDMSSAAIQTRAGRANALNVPWLRSVRSDILGRVLESLSRSGELR